MTEQPDMLEEAAREAPPEDEVVGETSIEDMIDEAAKRGMFEPGKVYSNEQLSNELYHRGPGESSTNLKHALRSAAHYQLHKLHPKPSTPAMKLGTWLHCLVLEPQEFDKLYMPSNDERLQPLPVPEDAPRKPTAAQRNAKNPAPWVPDALAWWDNFDALRAERQKAIDDVAQGKEIISTVAGDDPVWNPSDWDRLHRMRDSLHAHPNCKLLLQAFVPEVSMYWHEDVEVELPSGDVIVVKELVKCRYDARDLAHNIGWDLKTTRDASLSGFARGIYEFDYHVSERHYWRGQEQCGLNLDAFVFMAIEKEPPYACSLYQTDQDAVTTGDALRKKALRVIATAKETGVYPCYPTEPTIRELPTPGFRKRVDII